MLPHKFHKNENEKEPIREFCLLKLPQQHLSPETTSTTALKITQKTHSSG